MFKYLRVSVLVFQNVFAENVLTELYRRIDVRDKEIQLLLAWGPTRARGVQNPADTDFWGLGQPSVKKKKIEFIWFCQFFCDCFVVSKVKKKQTL